MPIAWPADLPQQFEVEGFEDALPDQLYRSTIDPAAPSTRQSNRRSEAAPIIGRMLMTEDQWASLRRFIDAQIAHGALAFDFPAPDGTVRVRFATLPRRSALGNELYQIDMELRHQ